MRQLRTLGSRPRRFVVAAAIFVITLAASSPIYSAVSGGHVIGDTAASSDAAAHGTAATADCSKAEAVLAATRFDLGVDPSLPNPIAQVLCGAFVGPGSEAMVASIAIPSCGRTITWAVFRWSGGAWELVMRRHNGADLAAVGSDIQETLFVLRPGDAHCFPTGGTRARTWHWNGASFTASAWKQVTKGKAQPTQPSRFDSPSRNITCWMFDGRGNYSRGVGCQSDKPLQMVNMNTVGRLKICSGIRCNVCGCDEPGFPPLGYGKKITVGRFRCVSLPSGVRCTVVRTGSGFQISRAGIRRVGP